MNHRGRSDSAALRTRVEQLEEEVDAKDREIDQIADIQQSLLPDKTPVIAGVQLAASYVAPERAGGDYYDFLPLSTQKNGSPDAAEPWLIIVADATGHGPSAAVVMAMVHSILHAHPEPEDDPGRILTFINEQMVSKELKQSFVTGLLAVLNPTERTFSFARAGHPSPLLREDERQRPRTGVRRSGGRSIVRRSSRSDVCQARPPIGRG